MTIAKLANDLCGMDCQLCLLKSMRDSPISQIQTLILILFSVVLGFPYLALMFSSSSIGGRLISAFSLAATPPYTKAPR